MPHKSTLDPKLQALLDDLHLDGDLDDAPVEPADPALHPLQALWARLNDGRERALAPGQLAVWKPGLKNRRFPRYGEPAVVVALLDAPLAEAGSESGSPYFREPLDVLLGVVRGEERMFMIYHADRRRFQPYEGSPASDGPER